MKKLFFLLLLGNVVFYLWAANIQPKQEQDRRLMVDASLEPIVLLSEIEAEQQAKLDQTALAKNSAVKQEKAAVPAAVKKEACYYTTLIESKDKATGLQMVLKKSAIKSEVLAEKVTENLGYWVMYPAETDMKKARANVNLLKDKGVKDYWLFRRGARKGAISLGMFKEQKRAEKTQAEWAAKSVKLEIRPHTGNREKYKLKIRTDRSSKELFKVVNKHSKQGNEIKLEYKRCN